MGSSVRVDAFPKRLLSMAFDHRHTAGRRRPRRIPARSRAPARPLAEAGFRDVPPMFEFLAANQDDVAGGPVRLKHDLKKV